MDNTNWRNFVPARTIADELRKFVITTDQAHTSTNVQVRHHGAGLGEVAAALSRLKEQLTYENRYMVEFANEFVSRNVNGVEILLRVLAILQRHLHETQNQSRLSALLLRNSTNKRRKAGITEADALECLKLLIQKTSAARILLEHIAHVEVILISVTSPQLDSKCYALELLTLLLDTSGGWISVMKALTGLAGKNRDDSRLTIIVTQLRHGLNTSKLHIQILVMRLLNKLISQAPSLNHQVLMQIEAENAGFVAESLERVAHQMGRPADVDVLKREILVYKNSYMPLVWLQRQAKEATSGYPTPNEFPRFTNITNGDINSYPGGTGGKGWRYDGETTASRTDYSQGDEDSLRDRSNRRYEARGNKFNTNTAVSRGIEKQRKRRDNGGRKLNGSIPIDPSEDQGMVPPSHNDSELFLERNPSYVSAGFDNRPTNSIPRPKAKKSRDVTREESMRSEPQDTSFSRRKGSGEVREALTRSLSDPPYLRQVREATTTDEDLDMQSSIRAPRRRQKQRHTNGDTMKRTRSENTLLFNDYGSRGDNNAPMRGWHTDSMNREAIRRRPSQASARVDYSRNGRSQTLDNRQDFRPYDVEVRKAENNYDPRVQGRSQSLHDLHRTGRADESDEPDGGRRFERMIPVRRESEMIRQPTRYKSPARDFETVEDRLSAAPIPVDPSPYTPQSQHQHQPAYPVNGNGHNGTPRVRRSQSDAAEKIRMQGFSYLFPAQQVLDNIPLRRAKTPGPMEELAMRHSYNPPSPDPYPRPPSAPIFEMNEPTVMNGNSRKTPIDNSRISSPIPPISRENGVRSPNPVDVPEGHVVYIPVRVEGTDQLVNVRPSKSIMKTPYTPGTSSTSTNGAGSSSVSNVSGGPIPGGYKYSFSTFEPDGTRKDVSYSTTSMDRRKRNPQMNGDVYRPNSPKKGNTRFANETYTEDVEDALRKFDYLNEYEGSSSRGSRYGAA